MALHRKKIGNGIFNDVLVAPVRNMFNLGVKKVSPGEGSSNGLFSVDDINLQRAPGLFVNPKNIPKILEDQILEEVQDLEHLDSELLQDGDLPNAVICKSTKLFFDEGKEQWVAEPHVRVWSNKPCAVV